MKYIDYYIYFYKSINKIDKMDNSIKRKKTWKHEGIDELISNLKNRNDDLLSAFNSKSSEDFLLAIKVSYDFKGLSYFASKNISSSIKRLSKNRKNYLKNKIIEAIDYLAFEGNETKIIELINFVEDDEIIEYVRNEEFLVKIVTNSSNLFVQDISIGKIHNISILKELTNYVGFINIPSEEKFLIEIAKNSLDSSIQNKAILEIIKNKDINEINDEKLLSKIIKYCSNHDIQEIDENSIQDIKTILEIIKNKDINGIDDEKLLTKISKNTSINQSIREVAICKISDENLLVDIAKNSLDKSIQELIVGRIGIDKINDQKLLFEVVKNRNFSVKGQLIAISKIFDRKILSDIANNNINSIIRKSALMKIEEDEEKLNSRKPDSIYAETLKKQEVKRQEIRNKKLKNPTVANVQKTSSKNSSNQNALINTTMNTEYENFQNIVSEKLMDKKGNKTTISNNVLSLDFYEKQIYDLEKMYQNKERTALEVIEKRFAPPQMTYDRFIETIKSCNQTFYKQKESILSIIEIATRNTPKIDKELERKLNILKSIVEKIDDLINELAISLGKSSEDHYSDEAKDLLEDMKKLIDSVKEYD